MPEKTARTPAAKPSPFFFSSALTCSSCTLLEKEGEEEGVSASTEATCCLRRRLSLRMAKDH